MAVQIVFSLVAFSIAIWLVPRWRRMRRHGVRNGAYYFVTLNVFGSIVFGAALLWQPCAEVLADYRASRDARELARFAIHCDRTVIEIRNVGDSPRHVTVGDVALHSTSPQLLAEPDSFYPDVQPRTRDIEPGRSARFELSPLDKGPCATHAATVFIIGLGLTPEPTCSGASFHFTSAKVGRSPELDTHATCDFSTN